MCVIVMTTHFSSFSHFLMVFRYTRDVVGNEKKKTRKLLLCKLSAQKKKVNLYVTGKSIAVNHLKRRHFFSNTQLRPSVFDGTIHLEEV